MPLDHFPLDAEITLTEIRSEEALTNRLRAFHRLRVRRRNEVVGVFLDVEEWRNLVAHVERLEAEAEAHEDQAVRAIIAARLPGALFEQGSSEALAEIDADFERRIVQGRPQ